MSESVQHAGSARHSTTGDVYCMRAVPVTPPQVMFTVCGQCPSLHAEGLIQEKINDKTVHSCKIIAVNCSELRIQKFALLAEFKAEAPV